MPGMGWREFYRMTAILMELEGKFGFVIVLCQVDVFLLLFRVNANINMVPDNRLIKSTCFCCGYSLRMTCRLFYFH